jgi:sRNA-binding regulator protein Hfq
MAGVVKPSWFGREISVMLANEKWLTGELAEVTEHYIMLHTKTGELLVMVHAIVAIRPAESGSTK